MMKDKSHIVKVFSVVAGIIILFLVVHAILRPESYGLHGPYRWNANNENQDKKLINQNSQTCKECHEDVYKLHEKDAHYSVPCVDCHGAGDVHVAFRRSGDTTNAEEKLKAVMPREYKLEGCLFCHRKLKARPSDFPQIDQAEHFKFLHVTDSTAKCVDCHNPHEPIYLLTDLRQSRIHPIVYKCTECHNKKPEKSFKEITDHPAIFECKDCHKEIVKDFSEKPHSKYIDCRTCHLYHKENETTGRIYKNGNAKFCLICHEKKSFKDDKYPPKIEWPAHIGNKNIIAKSDEKICLQCHTDKIHIMNQKDRENPHPENWKRDHKAFAKEKSDICSKCHTQSECSSCHLKNKPMSHVANWPKLHPKVAASDRSSCDFCHKQNSCMNCHKVEVPHPKDWADSHKDVVSAKGKAVCQKCHKEDFCKQCH